MELERDLVEPAEELEVHGEVLEYTIVLRLEGNVDRVLGSREEFPSGRHGVELGDLGEVELHGQVVIFVLDSQVVVPAVMDGALAEGDLLAANFDLGVASASHHLYLKVVEDSVLAACELHKGK